MCSLCVYFPLDRAFDYISQALLWILCAGFIFKEAVESHVEIILQRDHIVFKRLNYKHIKNIVASLNHILISSKMQVRFIFTVEIRFLQKFWESKMQVDLQINEQFTWSEGKGG